MKKRALFLAVFFCTLVLMAGCGNDKKEKGTTENENQTTEKEDTKDDSQKVEVLDRGYQASDYVVLGEYKGIKVSAEKAEVTPEDVKEYIESMLAYAPAYEELEKTVVEEGDIVNIDYEGMLDEVAFDGGTASNQYLEIGSGSFIDGFEDGLIGAKVGDKLDLNLTFPDPYKNNPDLAGKAVVFHVTVNAIVEKVEMTYESLTDEYVSTNFQVESVSALEKSVKENLINTNEYYAQSNARSAILDKMIEICKVKELPEGVLDARVKQYKEEFASMCQEKYGMKLEEYLKQQGMTEEDFQTQTVEYMKENIEMELILLAVAEKEGIQLDAEGYQAYVSNMMSNYGFADEAALYDAYGEAFVQDSYVCNKVLSMLTEHADITYTKPAEESADEKDDAAEEQADEKDDAAEEQADEKDDAAEEGNTTEDAADDKEKDDKEDALE